MNGKNKTTGKTISAAAARVPEAISIPEAISRLAPLAVKLYYASLADLVELEETAIEASQPAPSYLPLAWVALAETVGLTVDLETGRITGGPCNPPVNLVASLIPASQISPEERAAGWALAQTIAAAALAQGKGA
jgi:hypothetical protein